MAKKNIAVIFGGQSSEHEVSRVSARSVMRNIDPVKYEIYPIGITKQGQWKLYIGNIENITEDNWEKNTVEAVISPDASVKGILVFKNEGVQKISLDVVFPVLHGLYGEDGSIQGLFELAQIPYVGCGILASAIGMDKIYTKIVVDALGIKQAKYEVVMKQEQQSMEAVAERIEKSLGYPCFIKPSNAGSSVGISKAKDREGLMAGLTEAFHHDRKVLVEEFIDGREVECAVKGNIEVKAGVIGEIVPANEFYDFEAKYQNENSKLYIPAPLEEEIMEEIKEKAIRIFKALDGEGLSRVDFFVDKKTKEVIFNEINTLPGFTNISMYPKMWEAAGVSYEELIEELIQLALSK